MRGSEKVFERMRFSFACTAIFFLIIYSGCAKKDAIKNTADEEILRERVMAYWNHKVKHEFDKSYEYEDPFYRKKTDLVAYIRSFRTKTVRWKSVDIKDMVIEGETANLTLALKYTAKLPIAKGIERDSLIKEKWVKVDGLWYNATRVGDSIR